MAIQLAPEEKSIPRIVQAAIETNKGRMNVVGSFSLTLNAASTFVEWVNCSTDSRVSLTPETAAAAAAVATTYIGPADYVQGGFTVRHANNATADRNFSFVCVGG